MDTIIRMSVGINVGEQNNTDDAIEAAQNQILSMDIEELIELAHWYETTD